MTTDPLAEDAEALAGVIRSGYWGAVQHGGGPLYDEMARAVLASDWLAAHDAQVRADERQKVSALLADEHTVEKVADAICVSASGWPDHHGAWTVAARAALDALAGLIGGDA